MTTSLYIIVRKCSVNEVFKGRFFVCLFLLVWFVNGAANIKYCFDLLQAEQIAYIVQIHHMVGKNEITGAILSFLRRG